MSGYLLLRNNKETGPYSFNELLEHGLKPYDLVWVNGKSAAWRYPSEIEELKPFAPAMEEQPYDRFYKKSAEAEKELPVKESKSQQADISKPEIDPQVQEIKPSEGPDIEISTPALSSSKKQVYVSLPVQAQKIKESTTSEPLAKPEPEAKPLKSSETVNEYSQVASQEKQPGNYYESYMPSGNRISETEKVIRLEKRFSQPLDEIKDMYVQTLVDRKKKLARTNFFKKNFKNVAIIFFILALGVVMGFAFQNFSKTSKPIVNLENNIKPVDEPLANDEQIADNESAEIDNNPGLQAANNYEEDIRKQQTQPLQDDVKETQKKFPGNTSEEKAVKEDAPEEIKDKSEPIIFETSPGADKDPVTGERKKIVRTDQESPARSKETVNESKESTSSSNTRSHPPLSREIWKQVAVKTSNYTTGPFGGIKDLHLTVANNSDYPLDRVEVEVKYIGMEQQIVKTQTMVFNDIAPGGQARSEVPRTNRGLSVECVIKKINSRELALAKSNN